MMRLRSREHPNGLTHYELTFREGRRRGRLRWFHISDDEAWVIEWAAMPKREGIGSLLMDVLTGQAQVDGIEIPPYRFFSAAPGNWDEAFDAWAARRPLISGRPREREDLREWT